MGPPSRTVWLLAPFLLAWDYGIRIRVADETDIYELEAAGEITEEERDQLLDLLEHPLDPNRASREDLQKLPDVTWAMADAILARRSEVPIAGTGDLEAIVGRRVVRRCEPFLAIEAFRPRRPGPAAAASARAYDRHADDKAPVVYARARSSAGRGWEAGLLVAEEEDVLGVSYDTLPIRVAGTGPHVSLERAYVTLDRGRWSVLAGHYQAGFGQGLTFDVTDRARPDGFRPDLSLREDYAKYDSYSMPRRLLGLAASGERSLGPRLRAEGTVFVSSSPADLYFTTFEPHDWVETGPEEVDYPTFPNVCREDLAGMNATIRWGDRSSAGLTAWTGRSVESFDLDYTNVAIPNRDPYGAAGADVELGSGIFDVLAEAAVTATGGTGGRTEAVISTSPAEISLAWRDYGTAFDNPHSRGAAQPDWYSRSVLPDGTIDPGGDRDRDERGPQVAVTSDPLSWLGLRLDADAWRRPSLDVTHAAMEGRLILTPDDRISLDLFASRRDHDLSAGGPGTSYEAYDPAEETGARSTVGAELSLSPVEALDLSLFRKEAWTDDAAEPTGMARGHYEWAAVSWDAADVLTLAVRHKRSVEWPSDAWGARYHATTADLRARLPARFTVFARYVHLVDLTDEVSGPAPEHLGRIGIDWQT